MESPENKSVKHEDEVTENNVTSPSDNEANKGVNESCDIDEKTRHVSSSTKGVVSQDKTIFRIIADMILSPVSYMASAVLSLFGLESERDKKVRALFKTYSKRKRSDKNPTNDNDNDVNVDQDDCDEQEEAVEELEMKRWRPDSVLLAVERFISMMWGERDSNENIKENDNDENMNSFVSPSETGANGDTNWSKKPNINFVSDSFVSDINDMEGKGIQGTSTPCIVLNDKSNTDGSGAKVFVFSAEKTEKDEDGNDPDMSEECSKSTLTFEEKQAYFTEQIMVQEAEALRGMAKTPDKLSPAARTVN